VITGCSFLALLSHPVPFALAAMPFLLLSVLLDKFKSLLSETSDFLQPIADFLALLDQAPEI
jgi:hypothetical protein